MAAMARVLVTEEIAQPGLDLLAEAGHYVDVRLGLSPGDLLQAVDGAVGSHNPLGHPGDRRGAGRGPPFASGGQGRDRPRQRGRPGRHAPGCHRRERSAVEHLSAAEHTFALLLAQARNIPQAHAALKAGRWERSRWEGVELHGKTLGIVGLGRVGALVAQRALAFGMRIVAYDPYLAPERARAMGAELVTLDDLVRQADFLTIHIPKTAETAGLIGEELLANAKPDLRLVDHAARGGIVDEAALAKAVSLGRDCRRRPRRFRHRASGAPSPLIELDQVVVTPHLGASTREAQDKAGLAIAEQVVLALDGDLVPFAVNLPATEADEVIRPFVPLAERLGRLFAALARELPSALEIGYQGALADHDTRILTLAAQKGLLTVATEEPVSYVNAPQLAVERGLEVRTTTASASHEYVNLVSIRGGGRAIGGTLFAGAEPRIVLLDEHEIELPFAPYLFVVRNDNRVGMVALVSSALARAGINIVDLHLGRSADGRTAIMVISLDEPVPQQVVTELGDAPGILDAVALADV